MSPYCSKRCQASVEGYSGRYSLTKLKEKIKDTNEINISDKPERIHSERIGILSDLHVPYHSERWLARAIETFWKLKIDQIIVNGDFIDLGTISRHLGNYYRNRMDVEVELKIASKILDILAKSFKSIIFLSGNHSIRAIHKMGGEISLQSFYKMIGSHENVRVSSYSYAYVNKTVVVGHPRQYSRIRGNLAQKISQSWQKNIILGHEHHSAMSASADNKFQAVAVGCLADISKIEYNVREINDMPRMNNGFAAIIGERIILFDKFTAWEIYGFDSQEKSFENE